MAKHDIGKTIGELRKAKGWTQVELAEKLNVSDKTVSKWEIGGGNPDVETLPSIAEIFGVTLDYLMTGKEKGTKVEYVYTSKEEQCAKNDDVSLLAEVSSITGKDNNGMSLLDYVFEHESVKVFAALTGDGAKTMLKGGGTFSVVDYLTNAGFFPYTAKGNGHGYTRLAQDFTLSDFVRMCLISGTVRCLRTKDCPRGIKDMMASEEAKIVERHSLSQLERYSLSQRCVLDDKVFETIGSDPRVSDETFRYLISPDNPDSAGQNRGFWTYGLPYVIDKCYKYGQTERLDMAIAAAEEENAMSREAWDKRPDERNMPDAYRRCGTGYYSVKCNGEYGFVRVLRHTVELALERGDWKYIDRFSDMNRLICDIRSWQRSGLFDAYVPDSDALYAARVKNDKKLSGGEKTVMLCLHGGVLDVDELLKTDDYETIKGALKKYPIDVKEWAYDFIEKGNWKELLSYAVDSGDRDLIDCAILEYGDGYKSSLTHVLNSKKPGTRPQAMHRSGYYAPNPKKYGAEFDEKVREIKASKETILDNYRLRRQYRDRTDGLSKDYFYGLIEKKDYEMAVIKLCVLLEDVLKNRFGYEGELSDMLNRYCDDRVSNPSTRSMLNNLRMYRNGIVHPGESENLDIRNVNVDEIKRCVEYVCSLV